MGKTPVSGRKKSNANRNILPSASLALSLFGKVLE